MSAAGISETTINLAWVYNKSDAQKITINRSKTPPDSAANSKSTPNWEKLATVGGSTSSYLDRDATLGIQYYYQIIIHTDQRTTIRSNVATSRTLSSKPTTKFTLSAVRKDGKTTLNWQTPKADRYIIERAQSILGPWQAIGQTSGDITEYTDSGAAPNEPAFYRVRMIRKDGTLSYSHRVEVK